jgi:parvulin-like peptidyl-prolyl isomerase
MDDRRKNYRALDPEQSCREPISPRDALPEDDLVFFLLDLLPQLDLSPFHQYYAREMRGQPPFNVTMMVTLLVYAYSVGVRSSRRIAAACQRNLAFRAIVGEDRPDFRTISDFRKIHLAALRPLFLEVLRLAGEMGMVRLGNLSTDGTKMGANASRHKAMSYGYMNKEIERLEAEIEQLLKQAEQLDVEQDAALGSRRGDELPDELKRREGRLAKIREAKARLEAEARAKAEEEQRRRDEEQAQREAEGRKRRGKEPAPIDPTPEEVKAIFDKDPKKWGMMRASHILIASKQQQPQGDAAAVDKEALAKAQEALKEAKAGKDFAELAKKYSDDKGSAEKGGDLDYFYYEAMVPSFSKAAFALNKGEISGLVESPYGYHIIKAVDFQSVKLDDKGINIPARIVLFERNEKMPTLFPQAMASLVNKAKFEDLMPSAKAAKPEAAPAPEAPKKDAPKKETPKKK